jgi:hypothetical protein
VVEHETRRLQVPTLCTPFSQDAVLWSSRPNEGDGAHMTFSAKLDDLGEIRGELGIKGHAVPILCGLGVANETRYDRAHSYVTFNTQMCLRFQSERGRTSSGGTLTCIRGKELSSRPSK